jgi:hypothetical protein
VPALHALHARKLAPTTEAAAYRWLNTCFLVGEGEIDEEQEVWWLEAYVCVNERAQGRLHWGWNRRSGSGSAGRYGLIDSTAPLTVRPGCGPPATA